VIFAENPVAALRLILYFTGGQLVFNWEWDRQENFLITRDRPVGNKVTNAQCQSWVSYVQIQSVYHRLSKWCTDRGQSVCYA